MYVTYFMYICSVILIKITLQKLIPIFHWWIPYHCSNLLWLYCSSCRRYPAHYRRYQRHGIPCVLDNTWQPEWSDCGLLHHTERRSYRDGTGHSWFQGDGESTALYHIHIAGRNTAICHNTPQRDITYVWLPDCPTRLHCRCPSYNTMYLL